MENTNTVVEEILKGIDVIKRVGGAPFSEIRLLKTDKGTMSGYFDDSESIIQEVLKNDGKYNQFITLNTIDLDKENNLDNYLHPYSKTTTKDADIKEINLILIDVDPQRPAHVSSTMEELSYAKEVIREVARYLKSKKFPKPVIALSGNGYHLLYKVKYPNTPEITKCIQSFLKVLDQKFSTPKAKVDTTVYNPGRIVKLYGTKSCKGADTLERPHRRSRVLSVPEKVEELKLEILKSLLSETTKKEVIHPLIHNSSSTKYTGEKINVEEWLQKNSIPVSHTKQHGTGICYVLECCPWKSEHTDKSAYVVQYPTGAIVAKCHHDSCQNESWSTLRKKYGEPKKNKGSKGTTEMSDEKKSTGTLMIEQAEEAGDYFFRSPEEEAYVQFECEEHQEVCKVSDSRYGHLIKKRYYDKYRIAPAKDGLVQALGLFEAKASFEGEEREVFSRCAGDKESIIYFLANPEWEVVKISKEGWSIEKNQSFMFRKTKNMKAQKYPEEYNDLLGLLDKYFVFKNDDDRILHAVSLVSKLIPNIAHPIDIWYGEKGAAKTTSMRMDKSIIDPANNDVLAVPKAMGDFCLALNKSYMPCFDNIEFLSSEKSNQLCQAVTGGSISKRKLYTDEDETILPMKGVVSLNGINVVATKPDLLDRSILLELERVPANMRKEESVLWEEFENDKPFVLGAIMTALSKAIELYPDVQLKELFRMADFTRWGYAIAEAIGVGGEAFLEAFCNNQRTANEEVVGTNPVATAMVQFMDEKNEYEGTVTGLLEELRKVAEQREIDILSKLWPKEANVLSRRLNEIKSNLEEQGIFYDINQKTKGRVIIVRKSHTEKEVA